MRASPAESGSVRAMVPWLLMGSELMSWFIRQSIPLMILYMREDRELPTLSETDQAQIAGAYFLGYSIMMIPAGYLSQRFGGLISLCCSFAAIGLILCTLPTLAKVGVSWMNLGLTLVGALSGPFSPGRLVILAKWMPRDENASALTVIKNGNLVGKIGGTMLSNAIAGMLGWQSVFYFLGCGSFVYFVLLVRFLTESPAEHKTISAEEKKYIQQHCSANTAKRTNKKGETGVGVPWHLLFSLTAWVPVFCHIAHNFGSYTMSSSGIKYLTENFKQVDKAAATQLYSLTYIAATVFNISSKNWSKKMQEGGSRSLLWVRTLFTCGPFLLCALSFLFLAATTDHLVATALFAVITCLHTLFSAGYVASYLDVAGEDAGLWNSIGNALAQFPGFAGPMYLAVLLDAFDRSWWPVFASTAVVYTATALLFFVRGSTECIAKDAKAVGSKKVF